MTATLSLAPAPVVVYSTPHCVQCTATYRALDKYEISYDVVVVTEDLQLREYLKSLGHQQFPVVVIGEQSWSGFRPDRIKQLVAGPPASPAVAPPTPARTVQPHLEGPAR